jgi:hypothetical protein
MRAEIGLLSSKKQNCGESVCQQGRNDTPGIVAASADLDAQNPLPSWVAKRASDDVPFNSRSLTLPSILATSARFVSAHSGNNSNRLVAISCPYARMRFAAICKE